MKALITGATKGIGRAIAIALAKQGYDLAICSRNDQDLKEFAVELLSINKQISIVYIKTDCAIRMEVLAFANKVKDKFGIIDVLVNCVGLYQPGKLLDDKGGQLEKMMETNVYAAYYLSVFFSKGMIHQNSGYIFNICSIASNINEPMAASYSITKAALLGLSRSLRDELKHYQIRVSSILPGATFTESWIGTHLPKSNFVQPEDVAELVVTALGLSASATLDEIIITPKSSYL